MGILGPFLPLFSHKKYVKVKIYVRKINFHKAEQNWRNGTNKNKSICTQRLIMMSQNFKRVEMYVFEAPKIQSWNSDMCH